MPPFFLLLCMLQVTTSSALASPHLFRTSSLLPLRDTCRTLCVCTEAALSSIHRLAGDAFFRALGLGGGNTFLAGASLFTTGFLYVRLNTLILQIY